MENNKQNSMGTIGFSKKKNRNFKIPNEMQNETKYLISNKDLISFSDSWPFLEDCFLAGKRYWYPKYKTDPVTATPINLPLCLLAHFFPRSTNDQSVSIQYAFGDFVKFEIKELNRAELA